LLFIIRDVNFFILFIVSNELFLCTTLSIFCGKPNNIGLSISGNFEIKFVNYFWFFGIFNPNATYDCPFITNKLKYFFKYARNTFWSLGLSILPPYMPYSNIPYSVYKFKLFVCSYYFIKLFIIYIDTFKSEYEN
jgi:hypothetical protein